jgi:hypothetical protein
MLSTVLTWNMVLICTAAVSQELSQRSIGLLSSKIDLPIISSPVEQSKPAIGEGKEWDSLLHGGSCPVPRSHEIIKRGFGAGEGSERAFKTRGGCECARRFVLRVKMKASKGSLLFYFFPLQNGCSCLLFRPAS